MNEHCTLIKTKDLEDLKKKAESKKPEWIKIIISNRHGNSITSNIGLDVKLLSQLHRIKSLIFEQQLKHAKVQFLAFENVKSDIIESTKSQARKECLKELANMNWNERRKYLNKYKDD